ncbi:membrane protein YoeI [Kosakonia sacchari]|nr:membrane protein YoeI [Kosakonia sacchari]
MGQFFAFALALAVQENRHDA